jgi:hypothetical protein
MAIEHDAEMGLQGILLIAAQADMKVSVYPVFLVSVGKLQQWTKQHRHHERCHGTQASLTLDVYRTRQGCASDRMSKPWLTPGVLDRPLPSDCSHLESVQSWPTSQVLKASCSIWGKRL